MPPTKTCLGVAALAMTLVVALSASAQKGSVAAPPAPAVSTAPAGDRAPLPPIVSFMHSSSGWSAIFSFADPVTEIQWSLAQDGPFESTGFLSSYYTHLSSYRCAIAELRVGLDQLTPDRVVTMAPCDMHDPAATPANVDTHLWIDPSVKFATAQLVYRDGTVSKVRIFRRGPTD